MLKQHHLTFFFSRRVSWLITLCLFLFVACQDDPAVVTPPAEVTPVPENTPLPPTATAEPTLTPTPTNTPEPLAALVNQQPITLARFERELARYEQGLTLAGTTPAEDHHQLVLQALIQQALIQQAAAEWGLAITDEQLSEKITMMINEANGQDNFNAWLSANQWTLDEFTQSLKEESLAALVVERVTAAVPYEVEQVRARYLVVTDQTLATTILQELRAGSDFDTQAQLHSLDQAGHDTGFFPQGSLLVPELDTAAFALELNQISDLIPVTQEGVTSYYIVQLLERNPALPLTSDQRYLLLSQTFESWLAEQMAQAEITVFIAQ